MAILQFHENDDVYPTHVADVSLIENEISCVHAGPNFGLEVPNDDGESATWIWIACYDDYLDDSYHDDLKFHFRHSPDQVVLKNFWKIIKKKIQTSYRSDVACCFLDEMRWSYFVKPIIHRINLLLW